MSDYKAQLTLNGNFPQNDVLPEGCQFSCPWKARNPVTGEWHCTIYDMVADCKSGANNR